MIKDTRQMFTTTAADLHAKGLLEQPTLGTPDEIETFWEAWAVNRDAQGQVRFPLAPQRIKTARSNTTLEAYVSDGRWVADCAGGPTGKCRGGLACWPEHEHSCCLDCGTVYRIEFPSGDDIAEATAVLMARPEENRNWRPQHELIADLRQENVVHGAPLEQTWQQKLAAEHGISVETVENILKAKPKGRGR